MSDRFEIDPLKVFPVEGPTAREAAWAKATEHVNALATNSRGYQDGVTLAHKIDAIERVARFLLGESE
ncbi:hypothetical protein [Streptomyces asiaticus]|uniref:hypothetical protein n=1 Tax=Streptomyces asiaticus TaxID=114695 RepID=UPI001BA4B410|nr:hypothetical protein [Streptomyces asiaticus]